MEWLGHNPDMDGSKSDGEEEEDWSTGDWKKGVQAGLDVLEETCLLWGVQTGSAAVNVNGGAPWDAVVDMLDNKCDNIEIDLHASHTFSPHTRTVTLTREAGAHLTTCFLQDLSAEYLEGNSFAQLTGTVQPISTHPSTSKVVSDQLCIKVTPCKPGDPPDPHHEPPLRGVVGHVTSILPLPAQALLVKAPLRDSRRGVEHQEANRGAANGVPSCLPGASKPTSTGEMGFSVVGQGTTSGTATMDSNDGHRTNARGQGTAKDVGESGMAIDERPAAEELETGKGSQVSNGSAAEARQEGMTKARVPAVTSAVRLAMGAIPAATHFGTNGNKDTQMLETASFPCWVHDSIQLGYSVQLLVNLPANPTGAEVDPDPTEGGSLDSQMDKQGNTSSRMSSRH